MTRFEYGAKIVLYVLAALLPIFFIPWPIGIEFGREVVFGILIVLAAILWLLSILTKGRVRYQHSPILWAALLMLVVLGVSTIFSKAGPTISTFFADAASEKLLITILGLLLMVLAGSVFRSRAEVGVLAFILIFSGAVAGIFGLLQFLFGVTLWRYVASFATAVDFNVIGTANGLSLFYATLLVLSLGLIFSVSFGQWRSWVRYAVFASLAVYTLNLLLINFRTSWIVLFGAGIFFLGFILKQMRMGGKNFDWRYSTAALLLALSVVMIMVRTPLKQLNLPAEVSPAFRATLGVATSVFKEGPKAIILGSGPGTFGLDWSRFKDPSINQTLFWNVRFNQGYSWVSTLLPTVGVAGVVSFLGFIAIALFLFLKAILFAPEEETSFSFGIFFWFAALVLAAFLYSANLTQVLMLYLSIGVLTALLSESRVGTGGVSGGFGDVVEARGFWRITERSVVFQNPWTVFLSSLIVIFLLAVGVAHIYLELGRLRAAFLQQAGVQALNAGELDRAVSNFESAVSAESNNFRNYQALAQIRTEKVRNLIQRAVSGENVQQEFQSAVVLAIQNAQRSTEMNPQEPQVWRTQGALYELIIPFIPGSERFAFDSYERAAGLDPLNPTVWVDVGRSALIFADRVQLAIQQVSASERAGLDEARKKALEDAEIALMKAAEVKPDFATTHFLLSQVAIRMGNIQSAIRATENAKLTAPFDIGVAFQLGLLYYQNNDINRAEAEFVRATSLNSNFSNARYFLGLIYDRRGEREKAIAEFEQIQAFNPDNGEVKTILLNLRLGRSALSGIVPPGEPPERRKEAPVGE